MSILIGLHISRVLENNKEIQRRISGRVYPLVIPSGTDKYPYIVYDTNGGTGETTKDGVVEDVSTVRLSVISKGYREALEIGHIVRYAFENVSAEYDEFVVNQKGGVTYNDEYIDQLDAYAVNLVIEFRTIDK